MSTLKQLWLSLRSNVYFVAFYSTASGAAISMLQDEMASGKIDWSRAGLNKLCGCAVIAGAYAVIHLYRPAPGANPKP
jgi:hypothetical protein